MKVILLKDVPGIGRKYDVKHMSDGHAVNFLIPRGFAAPATPERLKRVLVEKAAQEGEKKVQGDLLAKNIQSLNGVTIIIESKANEQGHLFKGIRGEDIAAAILTRAHFEIPAEAIQLEHPIKEVGEWEITVSAGNQKATFKLQIQGI